MNPIEEIKKGILTENWTMVCSGYKKMTGETVKQPEKHNNKEEKISPAKALAEVATILGKVVYEKTDCSENKSTKQPRKKQAKKVSKKSPKKNEQEEDCINIDDSSKTPISRNTGGVRHITNNPTEEEIKQNKEKAKRTNKIKIDRNRTKKFKVLCNECETEFESSIKSGEIGQKCKTCLEKTKGRFNSV